MKAGRGDRWVGGWRMDGHKDSCRPLGLEHLLAGGLSGHFSSLQTSIFSGLQHQLYHTLSEFHPGHGSRFRGFRSSQNSQGKNIAEMTARTFQEKLKNKVHCQANRNLGPWVGFLYLQPGFLPVAYAPGMQLQAPDSIPPCISLSPTWFHLLTPYTTGDSHRSTHTTCCSSLLFSCHHRLTMRGFAISTGLTIHMALGS